MGMYYSIYISVLTSFGDGGGRSALRTGRRLPSPFYTMAAELVIICYSRYHSDPFAYCNEMASTAYACTCPTVTHAAPMTRRQLSACSWTPACSMHACCVTHLLGASAQLCVLRIAAIFVAQ
eukprot:6192032-Pleurochrysis_carterae.AAC.1